MTAPLKAWVNVLQDAQPTSANTPAKKWICSVWDARDGQGRIYKALSPEEYKAFYTQHSWWDRVWNCECKKLSLDEIATVSSQFIAGYQSAKSSDAIRTVEDVAQLVNLTAVDAEETIKKTLLEFKSDESMKNLGNSLHAFSARSTAKHTVEKTQGVWGKIKWTIWSNFYDTSARIRNLTNSLSGFRLDFAGLCKKAGAILQDRLIQNMEWFEESVHYSGNDPDHPKTESGDPATMQRYATPRDVQKKWLPKFAGDKFAIPTPPKTHSRPGVPNFKVIRGIKPHEVELAESSRIKVFALINIWRNILTFAEEQAAAPAPSSLADARRLLNNV
jgi:hypothetical protein